MTPKQIRDTHPHPEGDMSDETHRFLAGEDHSWRGELFWPQTTSSSDDICICCGNLRVQGHKTDCRLAKVAVLHDRMASMLRRLHGHWGSNYHCCYKSKHRSGGHDDDCIMVDLATLLRDLP